MKNQPGIIFDLDGTLYKLRGKDGTFGNSDFYAALKGNMYRYLACVLDISDEAAMKEYARLNDSFNGEVSIAVEQELGIDRYEWFNNTWSLNPATYIEQPSAELANALLPLAECSMVLTAAPAAWAYPVLGYLGLSDMFGDRVVTGEPDIRKPSSDVFCQAARMLARDCSNVVSIGDQNASDILPAKALGMTTVKVGPPIGDADYLAQDVYEAVDIASSLS